MELHLHEGVWNAMGKELIAAGRDAVLGDAHSETLESLRVVIIEDHPMVRQTMADLARSCVANASVIQFNSLADLDEFLQQAEDEIHVVVLDLILPGESSGALTVARCRKRLPHVPILAVSGLDGSEVAQAALAAGATAFVPKSEEPAVIRQAFLAASRGERFLPPALAHLLKADVGHDRIRMPSQRQLKVLELLARGLPDKQIARELHIADDTVAYHLKLLFALLDVKTRAQAVSKGYQLGLLGFTKSP